MINYILNNYLNNEKSVKFNNYTLDGITSILGHLNNPQKNFKSLHIAGTNGKGSNAYMLAKILQKSGYKTGLYTSPHLIEINERIKINSNDINDIKLTEYINKIDSIIRNDTSISATYFDILTAAAFTYFSDESVDIAVIETGLGGRLDSTNLIIPEISIITDISMDHMNILGDKIEFIAIEKCGIIKTGIPVITTNTDDKIIRIIQEISNKNNSKLFIYQHNFFVQNIRREKENFVFDFVSGDTLLNNITLKLFPEHQIKNAAAVLTSLLHLKQNGFSEISTDIIHSELKDMKVPGRFQKLNTQPLIIYDPAHNFDALSNLLQGLDTHYPEKNKTYIIAMMKDKADEKTLALFKNLNVVYYHINDERAFIPGKDQFKFLVSDMNNIIDILEKTDQSNNMIIFTGTFRIYSTAVKSAEYFNNKNHSG